MDLAKGTFIEKINPFWRWILFPIFSFFGSGLFRIIYPILLSFVYESDSLLGFLIKSAGTEGFSAFLLVYLAALTAPKHQFVVGIVVAILFAVLGGTYVISDDFNFLILLATLIGILVAVFQIHDKTKSET